MYVFHDETRRIKNITNQVRLQMSCQLYDYILNIYTFKHLHANIFYDKNSWLSKDFCFYCFKDKQSNTIHIYVYLGADAHRSWFPPVLDERRRTVQSRNLICLV